MNRASLRNEGKIHLGLIYANDGTRRTAFTQLDGALRFRAIVERWLGQARTWLARSTPFHYMVARDSVLDRACLARHYDAVEVHCRLALAADPALDYLGERPDRLVRPLAEADWQRHFLADRFEAGFATEEVAIDVDRFARAIRAAIVEAPGLTFLPSHRVRQVTRVADGFLLEGDGVAGPWRLGAGQVVNAAWERRLAIDRQLGLEPPPLLLHRLKYRVIARLPRELRSGPSVTMVLGRYGDVVVRDDGTAYLSWYPAGLQGWSDAIEPPEAWDAPGRGEVPREVAHRIATSTLAGIDSWYPGMGRSEPLAVDAGAIVALGRSDVDDAGSGLHDRSHIGVTSSGGWHSVDPGKLTTAPCFALTAADRVEAFAAGARGGG